MTRSTRTQDAARERMYIHAHDNRLQYNLPCAPLLCFTTEICVTDDARVLYYDKPPFRSGPAPFPCCCLPFTCCGPPVIYSKTPKCLCIDCSPWCGETLNIAPCNCYRLRVCLCFGSPCYDDFCGVPYFVGLKNAAEFSRGLKAAYDDNFRTGVGFDINQKESWPPSSTGRRDHARRAGGQEPEGRRRSIRASSSLARYGPSRRRPRPTLVRLWPVLATVPPPPPTSAH